MSENTLVQLILAQEARERSEAPSRPSNYLLDALAAVVTVIIIAIGGMLYLAMYLYDRIRR